MDDGPSGLTRETKRKLSPLRILDKAQVDQAVQKIGKEGVNQAQSISAQSLELKELKLDKGRNGLAHNQRKTNSVKGMKDIARARAVQTQLSSTAREGNTKIFAVKQSKELNKKKIEK